MRALAIRKTLYYRHTTFVKFLRKYRSLPRYEPDKGGISNLPFLCFDCVHAHAHVRASQGLQMMGRIISRDENQSCMITQFADPCNADLNSVPVTVNLILQLQATTIFFFLLPFFTSYLLSPHPPADKHWLGRILSRPACPKNHNLCSSSRLLPPLYLTPRKGPFSVGGPQSNYSTQHRMQYWYCVSCPRTTLWDRHGHDAAQMTDSHYTSHFSTFHSDPQMNPLPPMAHLISTPFHSAKHAASQVPPSPLVLYALPLSIA